MEKHIIDIRQFKKPEDLDYILDLAEKMEEMEKSGRNDKNLLLKKDIRKKILAVLFYEPSTRTRLSFESAMHKIGGEVLGTENAKEFSSVTKGESLQDTVKIIGSYADAIVLRHPEEGSAKIAADNSPVPVINAGDGQGQHPTQTLLDIYTIKKELGKIDNLKIAMVGDLLFGRTIHSLAYLLAHRKNVEMFFVSPEMLRLPMDIANYLRRKGIVLNETTNLDEVLDDVDVLYVTRIQKERFRSSEDYDKVKNSFVINSNTLSKMKKNSIIMHPLPRVNEISPEVDSDHRAAYFRQAENGVYVRMALLKYVLG